MLDLVTVLCSVGGPGDRTNDLARSLTVNSS